MLQTCILLFFFSLLFVPALHAQKRSRCPASGAAWQWGLAHAPLLSVRLIAPYRDDYAAVFFNPAGLGQIKRFEATLGFDFFNYSTDALYL
jgi:hypothetical protein